MRQIILAALAVCLLAGQRGFRGADAAVLSKNTEPTTGSIAKLVGQLPNGVTLRQLDKCPVSTAGNVSCADLVVPERRDVPGSRSITVGVAVLYASKEGRQPDPFLFLMGGQGQGYSVLNQLATLPDLIQRDVITLEQRGVQLAKPFFGCPTVDGGLSGIDQNLVSQPSSEDPAEIGRCKADIEKAGIDKNGYDTAASADDLWDVQQLLGIAQWNIFGVSYGGRTAESFLRKHPDAARSLILDSIQVTGIPLVFGYARLSKLDKFFSKCATAPGCSQFSNLKDHFERTVTRLELQPVPVVVALNIQTLTARAYIRIVTWILYTEPESAVHELPAAIVSADKEDYAPLLALEERYSDVPPSPPSQPGDYPFNPDHPTAQQTQVLCAEEYPPLAGQAIPFPEGWAPAVKRVEEAELQAQVEVCRQWDFTPSDPEQGHLPPSNKVPTLIVHGDHDTIAPSEDGDLLARSYPRSTRVVFPWTGHAIVERRQACFFPMIRAFLDSPEQPVNTSCAAQIPEPEWLPSSRQSHQLKSYLPIMRTVAANQVTDFGFPGLTVHLDLSQAYINGTVAVGFADPATRRKLTGQEPSRIASMTKTYTAAAILRLMEMGQIDLSGAAAQYLTNETQKLLRLGGHNPKDITITQLLQHRSGLPDFNDESYQLYVISNPQHQWTRREQVQWALNHSEPIGLPGTTFAYSDTGYVLLGEIIEQVSGLPQAPAYRSLLNFERLGIRHTWFETLEPAPTDLPARAHQFAGSIDATDFNPSFDLFGGGGLVSTVDDTSSFLRSLMTLRIFDKAQTLATMLTVPSTNLIPAYGPGGSYAMGIYRLQVGAETCYGHNGFWGTEFLHCPFSNVTVSYDRYQAVPPYFDFDRLEILTTALRINRLALHPAAELFLNDSSRIQFAPNSSLRNGSSISNSSFANCFLG